MKPKAFLPIADALAAEQRTIVAHSASYGFNRQQTHQAPAGAKENHSSKTNFFRPVRGLNYFADIVPTADAVGYYLSLLRSFDLWRIPSPIC